MVRASSGLAWIAATLGAGMALAACADILGIDDGTARAGDASVPDAQGVDAGPDAKRPSLVTGIAPPPFSPLACGSDTCNAVTQGCCSHGSGTDAAAFTYACVDFDGGDCEGGLLYHCDRPDNCDHQGKPGDVCCAFAGGSGVAYDVECATAAECEDFDASYATRLCNPGDDSLCPPEAGLSCRPSVLTVIGYPICK